MNTPEPLIFFRAAELANENADTDTGSEKQRIENIHHRRCDADPGKRQITKEFADYDSIDNIIKLLKNVAEDNRRRKFQQRRQRCAFKQRITFLRSICIHRSHFPNYLYMRITQKGHLVKLLIVVYTTGKNSEQEHIR